MARQSRPSSTAAKTTQITFEKQKEEEEIRGELENPKEIIMTDGDKASFRKATHCHICNKPLNNEEERVYDKVWNHCHITGKYPGAAHNSCNLQLRFGNVIPVVFHNLQGYDSHLIMQAISQVDGEITCIPNNMEKYISFSLIMKKKLEKAKKKGKSRSFRQELRFIDSAQFMPSSLD